MGLSEAEIKSEIARTKREIAKIEAELATWNTAERIKQYIKDHNIEEQARNAVQKEKIFKQSVLAMKKQDLKEYMERLKK
jgi:phage-related minor tail protein